VRAEDAEFLIRLLYSSSRRAALELYVFEAEPGAIHAADPHIAGTREHVLVVRGRMRVGPAEAPVEVGPGDLATFAADVRHLYEALEPGTRAVALMEYTG
jgi:quercetin dioxygenase-like cupin family protein